MFVKDTTYLMWFHCIERSKLKHVISGKSKTIKTKRENKKEDIAKRIQSSAIITQPNLSLYHLYGFVKTFTKR